MYTRSGRGRSRAYSHYGSGRSTQPMRRDLDEFGKPVILFDFSGVLAEHTSMPRSSGTAVMRPGLHHLPKLKDRFVLGIYTSCSSRTLETWLPSIRAAAGDKTLFSDPRLHLTRDHTQEAPEVCRRRLLVWLPHNLHA